MEEEDGAWCGSEGVDGKKVWKSDGLERIPFRAA